jgi:teichuronic acid exporter
MTIGTQNIFNIRQQIIDFRSNNFVKNLGSLGFSQIVVRVSRLLATIFLSRLLLPQDFGTAAIILTVYEFIALFTRNGISAKVVQASAEDVNVVAMTAWRMTWLVCGLLLVLQCVLAYPIAWFFEDKRIALPIAAMSIIYLATPMSNIQSAFQQRAGNLRRIAFASALQIMVDNLLTVIFALLGFGLWAIILPKILVSPIWLFLVRNGHDWRPNRIEGVARFHGWRDIVSFSRSVLGTELLSTIQANVDNLFVGYFLGLHALGIYYFAFNAGLGITSGLITAAGVAVFPYLCEVKQDQRLLARRYFLIRKRLCFGMFGLILIQTALAPIYVPIIFGSKWLEAIPTLCIICLSALARPFASLTSQLLKTVGLPEIELRWQIVNTLALILAVLAGSQYSILSVAIAVFCVQTIFLSLFSYFVPKAILEPSFSKMQIGKQTIDKIFFLR